MGVFFPTRFRNSEVCFFFPARGYCGEETMGVFLPHGSGIGSLFFPARGFCGEETMGVLGVQ